jgi:hypothetical protein
MNRIGRATDPELRTDLVAELILMTFRSSSRRSACGPESGELRSAQNRVVA